MVRGAGAPVRGSCPGPRGHSHPARAGPRGCRRGSRTGARCGARQGAPLRPARLLHGWGRCRATSPVRITLRGGRGRVHSDYPRGGRGRALSQDLERQLARWQSAGLIDARQAEAIAKFEAASGIVPFPSGGVQGGGSEGSITATEVITYAGALVTLAGLGTLLGTQYRQLGVIGRLAIPGLVAIAALLVARALPGERARARRAQTSLVTLAVAAIGLFTGPLPAEILGGPGPSIPAHNSYRILIVSATVAAVLAAVFLFRLRSGLLAVALSVSLLVTTIASIAWLQLEHGWAVELVFLATAAILVAAAEYGRQEKVIWATEVLAFAGPSMAIITTFTTARDGTLPLEIFGALLAGAAFAASVFRGSAGYAF